MKRFSVAIIGAGPAGSFLASRLNEEFDIVILDKNSKPRNKPCGGILIEESAKIIRELNPPPQIFSEPKELSLNYVDWDNDMRVSQKRNFQNVNRKNFDSWLLDKTIQRDNVSFFPNTQVTDLNYSNNKLCIVRNGKVSTLECDAIIDASGASSYIRRRNMQNLPTYVAVQYWFKNSLDAKTFDYILCNKITDYYSWLIPKGDEVVVGTALNPKNVHANLRLFKKMLAEKLGFDGNVLKEEGALILRPMRPSNISLTENNCFVIGEAAGLISPSTGEGISYALRSASNCADAINTASGDLSRALFEYKRLSVSLIEELDSKIERASALYGPINRLQFLDSMSK